MTKAILQEGELRTPAFENAPGFVEACTRPYVILTFDVARSADNDFDTHRG